MTTATSGVLARFPLLLPVRNSFVSYGASAVTRTSGRGHVAEAAVEYSVFSSVCVYYCRTYYKAVRVFSSEKTQIFYLVKEFALLKKRNQDLEICPTHKSPNLPRDFRDLGKS